MTWRVFLVERVDKIERRLRRFTYSGDESNAPPCPGGEADHHDAEHHLDVVEDPLYGVHDHQERQEMAKEAEERGHRGLLQRVCTGDLWPHDDGRWPDVCAHCDRPFEEEDEWQLRRLELYRPVDQGLRERHGTFPLLEAPIGAMWDAWWLRETGSGPDGRALVVRLPGGMDWHIDGSPSNAPGEAGWERAGEPPDITVSPSIGTPDYHGFLVDGELTDDIEGRTYGG